MQDDSRNQDHPRLLLSWPILYIPLVAGFLVSLLLYLLAGDIRIVADERLYVARAWDLTESGSYRGGWPPGLPWTISIFLRLGDTGLTVVRLFQIFCSLITGWAILQMSSLWFGKRGALLSGFSWSCYVPLAFFAHRLWAESLFLSLFVPAMYLFSCALPGSGQKPRYWILMAAGILFGLSLYFRESPILLWLPLTTLLLIRRFRQPMHAAAFLLCFIIAIFPWITRNYFRHGRFVAFGKTMNNNIKQGLNARYRNHDYNYGRGLIRRVHRKEKENRTGSGVISFRTDPDGSQLTGPDVSAARRKT
jgi:4-amino-4-deoxy-L-arabinose transferase-like glycosyltransferase